MARTIRSRKIRLELRLQCTNFGYGIITRLLTDVGLHAASVKGIRKAALILEPDEGDAVKFKSTGEVANVPQN